MKKRFWFFPIAIAAIFIITLAVMLLWNGILPLVIPAIKVISYWQAMGILVLSKILFGFGGKGGGGMWKYRMRQKWEGMSAEQKEQLKAQWQSRCGRMNKG